MFAIFGAKFQLLAIKQTFLERMVYQLSSTIPKRITTGNLDQNKNEWHKQHTLAKHQELFALREAVFRIRIGLNTDADPDPSFSTTRTKFLKVRNIFVNILGHKFLHYSLNWGLPGSNINLHPSGKMGNACSSTLEISQLISFMDAILTVLDRDPESVFPIRILH